MERAREELMKAIVFSKPTMSVLAMTGTVFGSSRKKPKSRKQERKQGSRSHGWAAVERGDVQAVQKKKRAFWFLSAGVVCVRETSQSFFSYLRTSQRNTHELPGGTFKYKQAFRS